MATEEETPETESFGRGKEDYKLADWLAAEFEGSWRYDHTSNRWHHWNGVRWEPDQTNQAMFTVASAARAAIGRGTWSVGGASLGESGDKAMMTMLNVAVAKRALEALATMPGYGTDGSDWDQDPYLLGCENGIVDLRLNRLVIDPDPTTLVTKTTGCKFKPVADDPSEWVKRAPRFMDFIIDITKSDDDQPDPLQARFLLQWFGASIFGFSPEQRFLLMTGIGRNGKGAMKHAMLKALGEYAEQFDANLYMRSKFGASRSSEARADLVALKGKRVTFFSEPEGNRFNEELLKAHTGGDRISARALYSTNVQTWEPTHSITFLVNDAPEVEDLGPSMAARVMVADFRMRYDGPKEDKTLYRKLENEKEGILAILCLFAKVWFDAYEADGAGLQMTDRVKEQSKRFMERNDPIARFLDDACDVSPDAKCRSNDLYEAYQQWHTRSGEDGELVNTNRFALAIEKKGLRKKKTNVANMWMGISPLGAMRLAEKGYGDDDE